MSAASSQWELYERDSLAFLPVLEWGTCRADSDGDDDGDGQDDGGDDGDGHDDGGIAMVAAGEVAMTKMVDHGSSESVTM